MADQCPECELIIITYAQIPAAADAVKNSCNAIEALYGTDFVKAKIAADPQIHAKVMDVSREVYEREKRNNEMLQKLIALLAA